MEKTDKRILLAYILVIGFVSTYFVGDYVGLWALDPGDGGGLGSTYTSLPGTPTLNQISPNPDTDSIISLDWSDSLRLDYYYVWRKKSGGSWAVIKRGVISSSFVDSSAKTNGLYYYRIEAINNMGGVYSTYKSVRIENPDLPGSAREAHLNIIVPNPSYDGEIQLTWTVESTEYHTVRVQRRLMEGSWGNVQKFGNAHGAGMWLDNTVDTFGTYEYRIRTSYGGIIVAYYWSNVQSVVIAQLGDDIGDDGGGDIIVEPPEATTLNPIIPSPDTDGNIELSWSSVSDATSYEVYRDNILRTTTTSTSYTDSDLTDGFYEYKIVCINVEGISDDSNIQSVTVSILAVLVIPNAPILNPISPSTDIDGSITINWASVSGATSYEIYRSISDGIFVLIQTVTLTSLTDSGLSDGTYNYKIISKNNDGTSGFSNIQSVIVLKPVIPTVPIVPPVETDYTITYALVGMLIGLLVVVAVIMVFRKRKGTSTSKRLK